VEKIQQYLTELKLVTVLDVETGRGEKN